MHACLGCTCPGSWEGRGGTVSVQIFIACDLVALTLVIFFLPCIYDQNLFEFWYPVLGQENPMTNFSISPYSTRLFFLVSRFDACFCSMLTYYLIGGLFT